MSCSPSRCAFRSCGDEMHGMIADLQEKLHIDDARAAAIADYAMGDSEAEAEFDHIVALTRELFQVSAAMVSIVTRDVVHFKARTGLDVCSAPTDVAFCAHALDHEGPFVIADAALDPAFMNNPLVIDGPRLRFYAGVPLRVASGQVIGTLCVVDETPRLFSERDQHLLECLGQVVVDRIEVRRQERELAHLAHYDPLTGLPNRTLLHERASAILSTQRPMAVLLFDLDGFKDVNDVFGHAMGDALLSAIGHRLSARLEDGQTLARLGGDEFVVIAPKVADPRTALVIAERLRSGFDEGFIVDEQELRVDTCIGVAISPYHGDQIDRLICHADLALYRAKERGAGSIAFYEPHLRHQVEDRQHIQHQLREAFERGEFEVHYQPQVRLSDETVVGVEALLRWRHPEHGLLTPDRFLPILDLMPLAAAVGAWVLDEAVAQAAAWAAAGIPLRVGINLFASQFRSTSLAEKVAKTLQRHGVGADLIELELTENIAVRNTRAVVETLTALRALGVGIALDDFGTGFASLSVLRDFPITRLKVDRSFVADIAVGSDQSAVVDSILTLGRAFGVEVIAEGIETIVQARWLRAKGCHEGQGWHYGYPVLPTEIEAIVSAAKGHAARWSA